MSKKLHFEHGPSLGNVKTIGHNVGRWELAGEFSKHRSAKNRAKAKKARKARKRH